jgi:formylglycine-generating enzyme required for sulfatase activity
MKTSIPRFRTLLVVLALLTALLLASLPVATARQDGSRGLSLNQQTPAAGHYHALVIGNNNYEHVRHLQTAESDAREVERVLRESYGFQTRLLINATRSQIIGALAAYRRELGPDANLLIYYAGHGYNDRDADKAYWLPVDASGEDPADWISADDITTAIRVIPARHVLVVSDSCYSGTLTRELNLSPSAPAAREQFLQKMMAGRSRTLMASGGNEPVADSGGGGHSVFASALLRGLQEMDKGRFTATELFSNYIVESVAGRAEQTPEYEPIRNSGHESGDFVFVKIKTPDGKTVEVTVKTPSAPTVDPAAFELSYWNSIQNSTDAEDFKDYLSKYPTGQFASIARRRVAALTSAAKPAPVTPSGGGAASTTGAARPAGRAQQMQNSAGVEFMWIPAGSFMMGSSDADVQRAYEQAQREYGSNAKLEWFTPEKPAHRVTIAEGFYMGKYEVTQAQWQKVMGTNPSNFKGCDNCPVEQVSWDDAQAFINRLNAQNDGYTYRLPSEAEWEYACRAGTTGDYAGDLDSMGWYYNNSGDAPLSGQWDPNKLKANNNRTHAVGSKQPNAFGLFDMHGNVWEWCEDWYHDSYAGAPTDGSAWLSGGEQKYRVLRGGSWSYDALNLRSAYRDRLTPDGRSDNIGLRVVAVSRQ